MDERAPFTLSILPVEIVEEILSYLDLATIKALRLSSRAIHKDCTGFRFKHFLRQKSFPLTRSGLQYIQDIVTHPILGDAVKKLKIWAIVYDQTPHVKVIESWKKQQKQQKEHDDNDNPNLKLAEKDSELSQAEADLKWLQAQQELQDEISYDETVKEFSFCLGQIRRLDEIELDAVICQGPGNTMPTDVGKTNWYPVWMRASRNYCIAMEAMTLSKIQLKSLNVYQRTPRCSVPLYDIETHLEMFPSDALHDVGKHLQRLSLSISNKVTTGAMDRPPRTPIQCHEVAWYGKRSPHMQYVSSLGGDHSEDDDNLDGLAKFLRLTPNLKSLEVHFYNTSLPGRLAGSHRIIKNINRETLVHQLRECSLQGIGVSQDSLIQFLSDHPLITDLTLCQITLLQGGSWCPVFAALEERTPRLERLHLATLKWAGGHSVNLHPVWDDLPKELEESRRSFISYVHTKTFSAKDISKGLKFREMPSEPQFQSTLEAQQWRKSVAMRYGLPWEERPKYVTGNFGRRY
jgi:hypothetical protein